MNKEFENLQIDNDEIDLRLVPKTLLREKKIIITITLLSAIISSIFALLAKPIWRGSFEIVTTEASSNLSSKNILESLNIGGIKLPNSNEDETQKLILKSESVLLPVFKFVKDKYKQKGKDISDLDLKSWIKDELNIDYEKGSNVLVIQHENNDKKLILTTLKMISQKYKEYSKSDILKNIESTIFYLEKQKEILSEKSLQSMRKFNKFSIDNDLGNFDGFSGLGKYAEDSTAAMSILSGINNERELNSLLSNENQYNLPREQKSTAGQRYQSQFINLEKYEAQYAELSASFKPNAKILKDLKFKIDNLKSQLKRPNKILIEYKNLSRIAQRDQSLLSQVESNLELAKLQRINTPQAWELISTPKIEKNRIFPQRTKIVLLVSIISFLVSSILALIKENLSGIIYNKSTLLSQINSNLTECFLKDNINLTILLFKKLIENSKKDVVFINYKSKIDSFFIEEINKSAPNINIIDFENVPEFKGLNKIYILLEEGKFFKKDIEIINAYINLYSDKISGLIFID